MVIYYTHSFTNTKGESHQLLEKAIAAYLKAYANCADSESEAARMTANLGTLGEFGKPYICGFAPFSISHSGGTWAVLISEPDVNCGLDIQYERRADAISIAKRFYAPEDAAAVERLSNKTDGAEAEISLAAVSEFFRLWTRREALVKAIGTSVTESALPAVSSDRTECQGIEYRIQDVKIPASGKLHAAVCFENCGREICPPELILL